MTGLSMYSAHGVHFHLGRATIFTPTIDVQMPQTRKSLVGAHTKQHRSQRAPTMRDVSAKINTYRWKLGGVRQG